LEPPTNVSLIRNAIAAVTIHTTTIYTAAVISTQPILSVAIAPFRNASILSPSPSAATLATAIHYTVNLSAVILSTVILTAVILSAIHSTARAYARTRPGARTYAGPHTRVGCAAFRRDSSCATDVHETTNTPGTSSLS
jgi:hypothetical protein